MIFSSTGNYIDEVMFNNEGLQDKEETVDSESESPKKAAHAIKNQNLNLIDPKQKAKKFEVLNFKGEPYQMPETQAYDTEVSELNKMDLL